MMKRVRLSPLLLLAGLCVGLAGCEASKSNNPNSPSVAGPIPGVNITAPKPLEPGQDWTIAAPQQPITLLVENSSTNGQRPVTYLFEVATDAEFGAKVFARDGVEPGTNGRTSLRLPDALAPDRTYYWRAKAGDGANSSTYAPAVAFTVVTPSALGAPAPLAPTGGVRVTTLRPEFVVRNASKTGQVGALTYIFEISSSQAFAGSSLVGTVPEGPLSSTYRMAQDLPYQTRLYWRARAVAAGDIQSPWTLTQTFLTPLAPAPPPPPPGPTPPPGPGPTPPPSGWPKTGPEVVAYVQARYPDKLRAGVTLDQRKANMEFIRDRMIEAGICGGMDLGLNLKRGGPSISIDFLVHKINNRDVGVDIGMDYDNTTIPLRLYWGDGAPFPFYKYYTPRPKCS